MLQATSEHLLRGPGSVGAAPASPLCSGLAGLSTSANSILGVVVPLLAGLGSPLQRLPQQVRSSSEHNINGIIVNSKLDVKSFEIIDIIYLIINHNNNVCFISTGRCSGRQPDGSRWQTYLIFSRLYLNYFNDNWYSKRSAGLKGQRARRQIFNGQAGSDLVSFFIPVRRKQELGKEREQQREDAFTRHVQVGITTNDPDLNCSSGTKHHRIRPRKVILW